MKYSIDKKENYAVMELQEDNLNSFVAPDLKSELVILSNEGIANLILDLSKVKYVDSSGLSAILTANPSRGVLERYDSDQTVSKLLVTFLLFVFLFYDYFVTDC